MAAFVPEARIVAPILALLASCSSLAIASQPQQIKAWRPASQAPQHYQGSRIVKLERQNVVLPKTAVRAGRSKNFYSAKVSVGSPAQDFHVSFDLGGGTMVLPSQSCTDAACLERRRYNRWISNTAEDIQANGQLVQPNVRKTMLRRRDRGAMGLHSIDVGSGKVEGSFIRDQVCVRFEGDAAEEIEPRCIPLAMLTADKMSDMPFVSEPYDGTIGLGLNGMSLSSEFNFLTAFKHGNQFDGIVPNTFGLHIGQDGGEITFGGYDAERLMNPFRWAPVADPREGRWQVAVSAIRVGNTTLEACHDRACRAAIDYSASLLNVPTGLAANLETALTKLAPPNGFGNGCQHLSIPDLHLELANDVTLTLPAEDFVSDFGSQRTLGPKTSCHPLLAHSDADDLLGKDVFVLGEATLRRYYMLFHADSQQVGFSLATPSSPKDGKSTPALLDGSKNDSKEKNRDNPIIVLVQVKLSRSKTLSSLGH